jgi:DNA mismatch repair ATPase MutS
MSLLTGPNMAGKSTILRSVCAVALLGACGLYAPAAAATLPYFDAFMLRNFSSDSPLEGRSSFAVEMTEMRYVLEDLTPNSLVLVDELGKGTEVRAGSSLAGALMEALDASRCRGVFATHLHSLLDLDLRWAARQAPAGS